MGGALWPPQTVKSGKGSGNFVVRDVAIGLGVACAMLFAMGVAFAYGINVAPDPFKDWAVTWIETLHDADSLTGTLQAPSTFPVPPSYTNISSSNVTRVVAQLAWTDSVGNNDEFELVVQPPSGTAKTARNAGGNITVEFLFPEPDVAAIRALDLDGARRVASRDHSSMAGMGQWSCTVKLLQAPGTGPVSGVETASDGANAFALKFVYQSYEAVFGGTANA